MRRALTLRRESIGQETLYGEKGADLSGGR